MRHRADSGWHLGQRARHKRRTGLRRGWVAAAAAAVAAGVLAVASPAHIAVRQAVRLAASTVTTMSRDAPQAPQGQVTAHRFGGSPPVGALFKVTAGQLGPHFCTGSVVASSVGDLVVTAAHCVSGLSGRRIDFVPGYHDGAQPFGVWRVRDVLTDAAWQAGADPDDDVAFLVVHQAGNPHPIQQVTGAEQLGIGWAARTPVRVAGYTSDSSKPLECPRSTRAFGTREMEFVCGGFLDGSSGSPFLAAVSAKTGLGTVIGVIGGYEQGGDLAPVSYSPRFGGSVKALYAAAVNAG